MSDPFLRHSKVPELEENGVVWYKSELLGRMQASVTGSFTRLQTIFGFILKQTVSFFKHDSKMPQINLKMLQTDFNEYIPHQSLGIADESP
jgi:hypothetical protein